MKVCNTNLTPKNAVTAQEFVVDYMSNLGTGLTKMVTLNQALS